MLDFPEFPELDEELAALVAAGGNSKAARSARAKLQLRDRYGRFIFMGRGLLKFKVRFSDGTVRSVLGAFVGARDSTTAQVYVSKDPSGLKTGFYDVKSQNLQEFVGQLSAKELNDRGIKLGLDANGSTVKERLSEQIPDVDKIPFSDSPIGWTHAPAKGGAEMWSTDDHDYNLYHSTTEVDGSPTDTWSVEDVNNNPGTVKAWRDVGFALKQIDEMDSSNPDSSAIDTKERLPEGTDVQPQDIVNAQKQSDLGSGPLDLDTFGVAREGFLIPTGKSGQDTSPEGLAQFVEANMDYLKEGSGKRLVVDTESNSVEIYTSADTLDNAKAQAGGIGAPEIHDLSTGEVIPNGKGRVAGEPANKPQTDERTALEAKLNKLAEAQAKAPDSQFERYEKQIAETQAKLDALDAVPATDTSKTDSPAANAPDAAAPAEARIAELEKSVADLKKEVVGTPEPKKSKTEDNAAKAEAARARVKAEPKKKEAPSAKDSNPDSGKSKPDDSGPAKTVDNPSKPEADSGSPAEPDNAGRGNDSGGDKPAAPAAADDSPDRAALERKLDRLTKRRDTASPEQLDQIEKDIEDTQKGLDALDAPETPKTDAPKDGRATSLDDWAGREDEVRAALAEEGAKDQGQTITAMVEKIQGMDGPPKVETDRAKFDALPGVRLFRGVSKDEYADRFFAPENWVGTGGSGDGLYTGLDADQAKGFLSYGKGDLIEMALDPDARVIDGTELHKMMEADFEAAGDDVAKRLVTQTNLGTYAAAMGYDAYIVDPKDPNYPDDRYYVLTNRSAVTAFGKPAKVTESARTEVSPLGPEIDAPEATNAPQVDQFGNTVPEGWTKSTNADGAEVWTSPDGTFTATAAPETNPQGRVTNFFTLASSAGTPEGKSKDWSMIEYAAGAAAATRERKAKADAAERANPRVPESSDVPGALEAIDGYDPNGEIADMINSGATRDEIMAKLKENPAWAAQLNDLETSQDVNSPQAAQKARWADMQSRLDKLNNLSLDSEQAPESAPKNSTLVPEAIGKSDGKQAWIEADRLRELLDTDSSIEPYEADRIDDLIGSLTDPYKRPTFVTRDAEGLVNGVMLTRDEKGMGRNVKLLAIDSIYTRDERGGAGSALMRLAAQDARNRDRSFIVIGATKNAKPFYAKMGGHALPSPDGPDPDSPANLQRRGVVTWSTKNRDALADGHPIDERGSHSWMDAPAPKAANVPEAPETTADADTAFNFTPNEKTLETVKLQEGMTIDLDTGEQPTTGFIVAVRGFNREIPEDDFFDPNKGPALIEQYIKDHTDELGVDAHMLGFWHDKPNHEVTLDVVEQFAGREDGLQAGRDRNQQSVYDVVAGESIDTGGTGDRAAETSNGVESQNVLPNTIGDLSERKIRQDFPGLHDTNKPLNLNENLEPTNSSAIFDLGDHHGDSGSNADDERIPATPGTSDSIDVPEDTPMDTYLASSDRSGVSRSEELLKQSQEGTRLLEASKTDIPYQDSDQDYVDEKFPPTKEQRNIIRAVLSGFSTVVQALAGTGKTTTLELMARQLLKKEPDKKIIYIAFNKTTQLEADGRMPKNVHSRTGDSLAYAGVDKKLTKKLSDRESLVLPKKVAQHLNIKNTKLDGLEHEDMEIARSLGQVIDNYSISADDKIGAQHFAGLDIPFNDQTLAWAEEYWADLNSPFGQIKYTFNHNFKIWALGRPDLGESIPGGKGFTKADIILFDEAQDINPVMGKVIRDQTIQKVYVGDARQAIYAFRGAVNEMDNVKADINLPLTQSWRFGPEIAGFGNRFLSLLGSPLKVIGGGKKGEVMEPGSMDNPDAILTRSNAGALVSILEELEKGRVVGTSKKFKQDMQNLVQSVNTLRFGNGKVNHEDLQGYTSWDQVTADVESGKASGKVTTLYNIVNRMGMDQIKQAVNNIRETDGAGFGAGAPVKWTPGAHGVLVDVPNKFGGMKPANYDITDAGNGKVTISVSGNTFTIGDKFRALGFKWNRDNKSWEKTGTADSMAEGISAMQNNDEAPIDVVVSTAHKAKGLEWDRVKIGDDFRGPQEEINEKTGESEMKWPEPEEMRLAYVAATRAQQAIDPGSLAWVFEHTDESDEDPNVPSKGVPGTENYGKATLPESNTATPSALPDKSPPAGTQNEPAPTPESVNDPSAPDAGRPLQLELPLESMSDKDLDKTALDVLNDNNVSLSDKRKIREELERREVIKQAVPAKPDFKGMTDTDIGEEINGLVDVPEDDLTPEQNARLDALYNEENRRAGGGVSKADNNADVSPAPQETVPPEEPPTDAPAPTTPDEPQGDGMPDTTGELEDLAGRLEIEKSNETNPIRKKILQKQLDKIYEKYEKLDNGNEATPANDTVSAPNAAPEAPAAPTFTPEEHVASGNRESVIETLVEAKDITPERKQEIKDLINEGATPEETTQILAEVSKAPDRTNIQTTPRPPEEVAENFTPASTELNAMDNDPHQGTNADAIAAELEFVHPDFVRMENGDMAVQSRVINGKRYDTIIRRTSSNQFFTYVTATDLSTGEVTATRLRANGQHSARAIMRSLNRVKKGMAKTNNPEAFFKKFRYSKSEYLGVDGVLPDNADDELIAGTDLPKTVHQADLNLINAALEMFLNNPDVTNAKALKALGVKNGIPADITQKVLAAVKRRQKAEANYKLNPSLADKPSHISFDGTKLRVGDWVDWTDNKKTRAVEDANGNTIYQRDAGGNILRRPNGTPIAETEPNPNYGRVYRGQVDHLLYEAMNPAGYGYGDTTLSTFIEKNIENGLRNPESRSNPHVGSGLQKVSGPNAPASEPFFPPTRVVDHDLLAANGFGVPPTGDKTVARPKKAAPKKTKATVNPATGKNEIEGFEGVNVPANSHDAALRIEKSEPKTASAAELTPGDHITTLDASNDIQYETVLRVESMENGRSRVTTSQVDDSGSHSLSERDFGPEGLLALSDPQGLLDEVIGDDELPTMSQINTLGRLLEEKNLTSADYEMGMAVLEGSEPTQADFRDMITTIQNIKEEPVKEHGVYDAVKNMFRNAAVDRARLDEANSRTEQDRADLRDGIDYGGYAVMEPDVSDLQLGTAGKDTSKFDLTEKSGLDLAVGDVLIGGGIGNPLGFMQVLDVNSAGSAAKIRLIRANDQRAKTGIMVDGEMRMPGEIFTIQLPAHEQYRTLEPKGSYEEYFAQTPDRAQTLAAIRRRYAAETSTHPVEDDPHILENVQAEADRMQRGLQAGTAPDGPAPKGGALHSMADFVITSDGQKVFLKRARTDMNMKEAAQMEYAANLVARAVGLDDVVGTILPDKITYASSTVPGNSAINSGMTPTTWKNGIRDELWAPKRDDLRGIAIMDYLLGNLDRDNMGNVMITPEGRHVPIDHQLLRIQHYYADSKYTTNSPYTKALLDGLRSGGNNLSSAELLRIKGRIQAMFPKFHDIGRTEWYGTLLVRVNNLIDINNGPPKVTITKIPTAPPAATNDVKDVSGFW